MDYEPTKNDMILARGLLKMANGRNIGIFGPVGSLLFDQQRKKIFTLFIHHDTLWERDNKLNAMTASFDRLGWKVVDVLSSN